LNKSLFLKRLQVERDKFELLLNRVGFTRKMTMKGVSGRLSIKDLLADVLTREQFIADRLNEIVHGESYAPSASHSGLARFREGYGFPDYESPLHEKDKPDHLVIYKHRNIGLDEIIAQELAAYDSILTALQQLTHDQILDHDLFHRIAEHTFRPYRRVSLEIRRWLKSITARSN
jgi:ribonucleotide monophosphatase NagD (HAD superfamily)